jgi:2-(3-amino-3-carboxypropyl)histidine synthase
MDGIRQMWRSAMIDNVLSPTLRSVGLITTTQYRPYIGILKVVVEAAGIKAVLGEPRQRCSFPGQVLGCSFECAEAVKEDVDAFIFLGEGDFHPLGVFLATRRHVFVLNPYDGAINQFGENDLKPKLFMKQRLAGVGKALDAQSFGVVLSLKTGQRRQALAEEVTRQIRAAGKKAYMVAVTEVTPAALDLPQLDAYVNTSCPRITYDDFTRFKRPILTPFELRFILSGMSLSNFFEEYRFDGFE